MGTSALSPQSPSLTPSLLVTLQLAGQAGTAGGMNVPLELLGCMTCPVEPLGSITVPLEISSVATPKELLGCISAPEVVVIMDYDF